MRPPLPSAPGHHGAGRRGRKAGIGARLAMSALLAVLLAGCSIPLPGFGFASLDRSGADSAGDTPDPPQAAAASPSPTTVTGSLAPAPSRPRGLAAHLAGEDLRRAQGAMALALDPQGNGAPMRWDNAESGASGVFTPLGGPYLHEDEVCRRFSSVLRTASGTRQWQGRACRPSGGDWSVLALEPQAAR